MSVSPQALLVFLVALALLLLIRACRKRTVLYVDSGASSRVFRSRNYRISAKPDLISRSDNKKTVLKEYKSRHSGIYPSDRAQVIASVIAVREQGVDIDKAFLQTSNNNTYPVDIRFTNDALFEQIRGHYEQARLAINGHKPSAYPSPNKCKSCGVRHHCPYFKGRL